MGSMDDYLRMGGLAGYAQRVLSEEFFKAANETHHPLREVFISMEQGNPEQAGKQLFNALKAAACNDTSVLRAPALIYYILPLERYAQQWADQNPYSQEWLEQFPYPIRERAIAGAVIKELQSRRGSKKGIKNYNTVIDAWKIRPESQEKRKVFVYKFHKANPTITISSIERYVRKFERDNKKNKSAHSMACGKG